MTKKPLCDICGEFESVYKELDDYENWIFLCSDMFCWQKFESKI
jgi:hypothetical protein